MSRPWPPIAPRAVDTLLALAVAAGLSVVVAADQANPGPIHMPASLAYVWATGLGLLMLIRRQMPLLVLTLTTLGFFTYYAAGFPSIGVAVPIAAALFSAAEQRHVRAATVTLGFVLVVSTLFRLASGQDPAFLLGYELVTHLLLGASVIALGYSVRVRSDLLESRAGIARLAAAASAAKAAEAAHDERLSLARELHDSIGHSLAVAALFTDVARENHTQDTRRAASALTQVRASISEALGHLRSTVALLRTADRAHVATPGLDRLEELLEAPASAGYEVVCTIDDQLEVDETVSAVVYRVVQEAVTNALKHSEAERLVVTVVGDAQDQVHTEVTDISTARSQGAEVTVDQFREAHGLAGMQERIRAVGGTMSVTRRKNGWTVRTVLPRSVTQ